MKEYASGDIRNFALVGHGASGKTMLAESMLVCAGEINRLGTIEAGSTVSDYHPEEKERQILAVADLSVVVIHAVNGVEVGTEQVVGYSTGFDIPKVLVINGLDREHTKFDTILAQCKKRFGNKVFPMQLPVNAGPGFNQIVDVLRKELITYKTDGSGTFSEEALPEDWEEKVNQLHEELIEYVAESDDTLLEKFFDEGGLSEEEMRGGIHQAVQDQSFIPLFCTAAGSNIGVARLMDFLSKYGSSPLDREKVSASKPNSEEEVEVRLDGSDPVVFVFKTISEAHVGELSFFRVYSGKVSTGMDLYNASQGHSERFGQMFVCRRHRSCCKIEINSYR